MVKEVKKDEKKNPAFEMLKKATQAWAKRNEYPLENVKVKPSKKAVKPSKKANDLRRVLDLGGWSGYEKEVTKALSILLGEKILSDSQLNGSNLKKETRNGFDEWFDHYSVAVVVDHKVNSRGDIPVGSIVMHLCPGYYWIAVSPEGKFLRISSDFCYIRGYWRPATDKEIMTLIKAIVPV
jgi:hypothetical protein